MQATIALNAVPDQELLPASGNAVHFAVFSAASLVTLSRQDVAEKVVLRLGVTE